MTPGRGVPGRLHTYLAMTRRDGHRARHTYAQALRASIGVNASAYGYSVKITVSFAMLAAALGSPGRLDGFLFVFGAAASFASMELIATRRFHKRVRGERPSVVVVGSAMSFASIGLGVGVAVLVSLWHAQIAWLLGSYLASTTYLLVAAVELLLGRRAEEHEGVDSEG